ncbi:MAG TPA: 30S ribosomal protein S6 [Candidatus Saccharimonadales bacterium]|nr:30S ribosomal protein S6 [Candidatus Saccharimonadales bacterium]
MIRYEIAVLYDPGLEIDLEKATSRVEKILTDNGAKIVNTDNWGKRKLAYSIKGHEMAIYVFYTVEMPGANVQKLESILNITDEVIRFLITKPDLKAMAKAEAAKALKAEQAAKRGETDDKEDEGEE